MIPRALKLAAYHLVQRAGLESLVLASRWRRRRLLILCYHGVAIEDEHLWAPALFLPPPLFRRRLDMIRQARSAVLPLAEALERLFAGTLPERAVTLTFDDGGYDFYRVAFPILREFGFPVTVYLTTYYSAFNRPVFDVMLSYLLWKGRGQLLSWPQVLPQAVPLDDSGRSMAIRLIHEAARRAALSGRQKDDLLAALAARLSIDYPTLCARRLLHLMNPDEVREVAAAGVEVQLHTHRHRVSRRRDLFMKEIEDNRRAIEQVSPSPAVHFCYPSGRHLPEFEEYLAAAGVRSAVTCRPALATKSANPYLLPRVLDVAAMAPVEFEAWLSGIAGLLPRRRPRPEAPLLLEDDAAGA
jgi:peptidoglycan/xylan/chitin deacetylase (PgdA/CDA1 family)